MDKGDSPDVAQVITDSFQVQDADDWHPSSSGSVSVLPCHSVHSAPLAAHIVPHLPLPCRQQSGGGLTTPNTPSKWATQAFSALNVVTGCAAIAVAKQMVNPANIQGPPADLSNLPKWYQLRFPQTYQAQVRHAYMTCTSHN
jgi:hypothetical protein